MEKEKKKKIGAIIADIFLFLFLAVHIVGYLTCLSDIFEGVTTGLFGSGDTLYGVEAYMYNFSWVVVLFIVILPITPAAVIYDTVFTVIKLKRKTMKRYELIAVIATGVLILAGFILFLSQS